MTILTPRVRTIGVRLREDEYSLLERFCVEAGAHSIADVARSAIRAYIQGAHRKNALAWNANRTSILVKDLETKVGQLTLEIAQLRASTELRGEESSQKPKENEVQNEESSSRRATGKAGRPRAPRAKSSRTPEPRPSE